MTRLARAYLYIGFLAVAVFGCATVSKAVHVADTCAPSPGEIDAVFAAASNPVQASALAAIDLLDFALCVKQAAVDEQIAVLAPPLDASLATVDALTEASPVLPNLRAWRAAHP